MFTSAKNLSTMFLNRDYKFKIQNLETQINYICSMYYWYNPETLDNAKKT